MDHSKTFTEGKIFGPLVRFALPILFALFLQALYGAADLLIAGRFGGPLANEYVSAIASGSQLTHTLTVIITGLSMGLTVTLAEAVGAGKKEEASRIMGTSILLFGALSLALSVVFFLAAERVSGWLGVPAEAFEHAVSYIRICSIGLIFIVFYNLLGSIFRGIGDSVMPLITVALAAVINIVLDYIFIAWYGLGTSGAALATVLAQAVSVLLSLLIIRKGRLPFAFGRKNLVYEKKWSRKILKLGIPLAIQDFLVSLSFLAILVIVNQLGLLISAGAGVAEKVVGFIMLVPSAFSQSMSAFVGQNMGAGKPGRATKALVYGIATSLAAGVIIGGYTFFFGDQLAAVFSQDAQTIQAAFQYLKAYAIDTLLTSFLFCWIGYFNGCEDTTFVMAQGIVGGIFVRLPASFLLSKITPPSLFLIGLATPLSSFIQILMCFAYYAYKKRRRIPVLTEKTA